MLTWGRTRKSLVNRLIETEYVVHGARYMRNQSDRVFQNQYFVPQFD